MRTIIAGSRAITQMRLLEEAIKSSRFTITEVVCGKARGVDRLGWMWAEDQVPPIPVKFFEPNWDLFGKAAGPIRNQAMLNYAQAAIILWDGESRGTKDMLNRIRKKGLRLYLLRFWEM